MLKYSHAYTRACPSECVTRRLCPHSYIPVTAPHLMVSAGDGRMCTWGRRVRDESGVAGWTLERITPAPTDRCGAVTGMYECGHNLLVTHADGQARVYA